MIMPGIMSEDAKSGSAPGVQNGKEADLGLQILPARGDFGECFCRGPEQQVINHSLVLKRQTHPTRLAR